MALPLQQRAIETDDADLVRLTLIEGGASPQLASALIPTRPLAAGEQYRFHFDMTKCIGCRSCEVACNEQNGNPADIRWRRVGELEGGTWPHTLRTYLSMGCNHCLSADCLRGCPVNAYTKDPLTGIVLHSAEACIGCQYCVWNCPYSVPQFNPERGVVGKCDMCRDRLLDGREPACVNACPENAIQIEIVNKLDWIDHHELADSPGLPAAGQTISTTRITLPDKGVPWLDRVDTGSIPLEHAHPSLVLMTTCMQAAFGALCVLAFEPHATALSLTFVLALTTLALAVSVFHLGRPLYAFRAVRMWRRSWLSREVLCFGLFAAAVTSATASAWSAQLGSTLATRLVTPLIIGAILAGLAGTLASACIYLVRARPAWNLLHTPLDFLLSAGLLGTSAIAAITPRSLPHTLPLALSSAWILNSAVRTLRLRRSDNFERRASYNLLRSESLWWKLALSWLAACATVVFLAAPLPLLAFATACAAVLLQRYLFFVSVVPMNMGLTFLGAPSAAGGHA